MKNKKAFTVVELVIVIAIIAILAAVLIPTFANIIKKANVSKDQQLIRNLNTALASDRAENGGKNHRNMTEALAAAEKFGYEVGKINASGTDNEILWDSKNDLFCYFDGNDIKYIPESVLAVPVSTDAAYEAGKVNDVDYWVIRNVTDTTATGEDKGQISAKYSTYLAGLTGTDATLVVTKGIDVGTNVVASVKYENTTAQEATIVTNGGELIVDAKDDTVKHFGNADSVNIVKVATASYHEFGTVPFIQISEGRLEIEAEANVNGIHVANVQVYNESTGKYEKTENTFSSKVTLTLNGADVKLSRDPIGLNLSEAVLVCEVQADANSASEFIWLVGNGTLDDAKVVVTPTNVYDASKTVTNATASEAAKAIANYLDGSTVIDGGKTADEAKQAAMFRGEGTEASPYEIYNGNDWYNLLTKYQGYYMGSATSGLYVVLKGDVDITGYDITSYYSYPRNFHLDGNGFTMKNFETSIWGDDATLYLTNTFTNIKLENCHSSSTSLFGGTQNSNTASATFNNVDLNNCSAVGGAYQYYDGSATATFVDCDATNTNVLGGYMASGGFVGNISTGKIVIDHCSFGGSVVSTQSACGGFVGQTANYDANKITIKNSTVIAGTIIRNVAGGSVAAFNAHTGSQDYAQFNNTFYGTLETTGTKYKQGTDAATKTYEPVCTAADFTLNSSNGTLTYNGSAGLGKIAVQVYVTDDYIYNGTYYGGYNWYLCDPIKANDVVNGTTISGIPVITDFYNVVSSTSTPVGLQTTDTTYVGTIHNGVFYFDAQTYSWGHYMLGGTYKNGSAVEPSSMKVYIKITVYDNSGALIGVVSGATLNYTVDLSNHGN